MDNNISYRINRIAKKLPILTSFSTFLFLFVGIEIASILVLLVPSLFVSEDMVVPLTEFGVGITAVFFYFLYDKKWKKLYPGCRMRTFRKGKNAPWVFAIFILFTVYTVVGNLAAGELSFTPKVLLTAFLFATGAGLFEEILVRGILVPRFLALSESRYKTWIIAVVTASLFSSLHLSNMLLGASVSQTMLQAAYTFGMGILFAAMIIYTGSIVPGVVCHFLTDFTAFLNVEVYEAGGVLVSEMERVEMMSSAIFAILTLAAGVAVMMLASAERKDGELWEVDPNGVPEKEKELVVS